MNQKVYIVALALLVFYTLAWLNSGTLSLYAITHMSPLVSRCGYLLNIDHWHFESVFHFLNSSPGEHSTMLLRRILYPALAYYPMLFFKWLNFGTWFIIGGFFTSLLLYTLTIVIVWKYLKKYYGCRSAIFGLALLVTYPGIYYWIGSPYAYNWIVPGSIFSFILLDLCSKTSSYKKQLFLALALGLIYLGYDLWVFFLPASIFMLFYLKRFLLIIPFAITSLTPTILYAIYLTQIAKIDITNSNSEVYTQIISSYFNLNFYNNYHQVINKAALIFVHNFFYSNFFFLPVIFVLAYLINCLRKHKYFDATLSETVVLMAVFLLFCFNNLAPYSDAFWQMRGAWIARLYQPAFVVFLFYLARNLANSHKYSSLLAVSLICLNLTVCLAPILNTKIHNHIFYNFYRHSQINSINKNIEIWGRRPLGFCMRPKKVKKIIREHS